MTHDYKRNGTGAHRREERSLIAWYRALIEQVAMSVSSENLPQGLEIAALPDQIRGYESIKTQNIAKVKKEALERLSALQAQVVNPVHS